MPAGVIPQELTVSRFTGGQWVPLTSGVVVDQTAGEVRAQLDGFSMYAVTEKSCAARLLPIGEAQPHNYRARPG